MSAVMHIDTTVPPGAQAYIGGLWYKIGAHSLAYYWNNGEWIRSTRSAAEIRKHIQD